MLNQQHVPMPANFFGACQLLWEDHVRSALLFRQDRLLCKGCLKVFPATCEQPVTHPTCQVCSLEAFCREESVTCQDSLARALWVEACRLQEASGHLHMPGYGPLHAEMSATTPLESHGGQQSSVSENRDRLANQLVALESKVQEMIVELARLKWSSVSMHSRLDNLTSDFMSEKSTMEERRLQAGWHLQEIFSLLGSPRPIAQSQTKKPSNR